VKTLLSPQPAAASHGSQQAIPTGPAASFIRFVIFGGGVGVLSSLAVPLLATLMPWTLANALITVASTLLCTELHARYTFRTGRRAGWRRHWQSAGSAAAAYVATSAAMFGLHALQPNPGLPTEQIVYLSASGLAGIGRFLILRLFVFATGRDRDRAPSTPAPASTPDRTPRKSLSTRTCTTRTTRTTRAPLARPTRHRLTQHLTPVHSCG
jgi:putative flippase GtrA